MAVGETTDDTKGVNMWYVITALVSGGAWTAGFSIVIGKNMREAIKRGYKPNGVDIMMFALCAYTSIMLFAVGIYCLVNMKAI